MTSYKVIFKSSVEKDLRALQKSVIARVMSRIEDLVEEVHPHQSRKLTGTENLYRIRFGDYRIINEIDDKADQVTILYVRHRRQEYRGL